LLVSGVRPAPGCVVGGHRKHADEGHAAPPATDVVIKANGFGVPPFDGVLQAPAKQTCSWLALASRVGCRMAECALAYASWGRSAMYSCSTVPRVQARRLWPEPYRTELGFRVRCSPSTIFIPACIGSHQTIGSCSRP